jgi:hypothetical protein
MTIKQKKAHNKLSLFWQSRLGKELWEQAMKVRQERFDSDPFGDYCH